MDVFLVGRGGGGGGGGLGISLGWKPSKIDGGSVGRCPPFPVLTVEKFEGQCLMQIAGFSFS